MIALKNTTNNQIFYIIHRRMDGETGWDLTDLNVEYTENGTYSIIPPSGYDGLSAVNVTVDVAQSSCNLTTSTVAITGEGEHTILPPVGYDGFSEVVVTVDSDCNRCYDSGVNDQKAKLASTTFTENGSYNREDGWNNVLVDVDTVTPYNNGKADGVAEQKAKLTSLNVTENGTYRREDGYNEVVVSVAGSGDYEEGRQAGLAEQKSKLIDLEVTENGTYEREDGYGRVDVNVDTVTPYNNGVEDGEEQQKAKLATIVITANGIYTREDGYDRIIVNVVPTATDMVLSANDIVADLDGGDYPEAIYSTADWEITSHPNWVTIDKQAGNAGVSTVTVTIAPSESERSGYITVTNGTLTRQIHIIQRDVYGGYLTIEATSAGTLGWRTNKTTMAKTIEVSLDNGSTWTTKTAVVDNMSPIIGTKIADLQAGDKVLLRGSNAAYANSNTDYNCFTSDDNLRFNVYGNIMSLINNDNFSGTSLTAANNYAFAHLFWGCKGVVSAENLVLPNNTVEGCYKSMFFNCTNLVEAPVLPATVMSVSCYEAMFNNTGLTEAPSLPSTTLANRCYYAMFSDCDRLTVLPELPATTLAPYCYYSMFDGCSLLVNPQSTLPATNLASHCYEAMYSNCSRLASAPTLPATVLADNCYNDMFQGCINLVTAPDLIAPTLVNGCYNEMFKGCIKLENIKCLATSFPQTRCVYEWVTNVASRGTFTKGNTNWWSRGVSGIPNNWTVVTQ